MQKICYSCSAPLHMPEFKGPAENYCKYCTDDQGNLKPREEIKRGITEWFRSWQPGIDHEKAAERAELFMRSMPAWAD
jgi:hypothetical protein